MEKNSKSAEMVKMYNKGLEIKEIAKKLDVRYNFVYNVISNYCRINDIELRTVKRKNGENKKDKIIEMLNAGLSCVEISGKLKSNINYVYKVRKELENEVEKVI